MSSDAILQEFLLESLENLSNISEQLMQYEKNNTDKELLNSIYRKVHTLKGSASFLGFTSLESITHSVESILDLVRDDSIQMNEGLMDVILESFDVCNFLLKEIEDHSKEITEDHSELISKLSTVLEAQVSDSVIDSVSSVPLVEGEDVDTSSNSVEELKEENSSELKQVEFDTSSEEDDLAFLEEAISEVKEKPALDNVQELKPDISKQNEIKIEEEPVKKPSVTSSETSPVSEKANTSNLADTTVRVNVRLLDKIMNVVGELVLNRNQILQYSKVNDNSELNRLSQQLNVITTELQTDIMTTRMQPVGSVFTKFERIVRDLSRSQSKKIDLEINGQETELDKTVLEVIKDPMTHIVRNAIDHAIETPDERKSLNKPEEGHVSIRAFHEGGQVIIEISDDGKGIDHEKVLSKAISKGVISADEAAKLDKKKIIDLIFHPGFSTAEKVTNISGRGVGMDVVRTNIEKIGGEVAVSTEVGQGSTFKLIIPLTLAIVPALMIESFGETFAIPQKNLVELVMLEEEEYGRIEKIHGDEFFRLRGELIPIFRLNKSLEFVKEDQEDNGTLNIIVLKAEGRVYGLIADHVLDTLEIVVKPLSKKVKSGNIYAGATIMGDGNVALILDAYGFFNMVDSGASANQKDQTEKDVSIQNTIHTQEMVLFTLGDERTYAIPLQIINRLEEFSKEEIEWSGEKPLIRYNNQAMPIYKVEDKLRLKAQSVVDVETESKEFPCIVINNHGRNHGLVVKEIIDITLTHEEINSDNVDREGILGITYIDERLVTVLDVYSLIGEESDGANYPRLEGKVLVLEDSPLFKKLQQDLLTRVGVDFVVANDGLEGLDYLEKDQFDLVLTDVEMPNMDGFTFASKVRESDSTYKDIPIIAITTRCSKEDREKGKVVGFSKQLEKLDKTEVVETLNEYLRRCV